MVLSNLLVLSFYCEIQLLADFTRPTTRFTCVISVAVSMNLYRSSVFFCFICLWMFHRIQITYGLVDIILVPVIMYLTCLIYAVRAVPFPRAVLRSDPFAVQYCQHPQQRSVAFCQWSNPEFVGQPFYHCRRAHDVALVMFVIHIFSIVLFIYMQLLYSIIQLIKLRYSTFYIMNNLLFFFLIVDYTCDAL